MRLLRILLLRILRRPAPVALGFLALLACAALAVPSLRTELEIRELSDAAELRDMRHAFKDGLSAQLILAPRSPEHRLTARELCLAQGWLRGARERFAGLMTVSSPLDARRPDFRDGKLWYPTLLGVRCDEPGERPVELRVFEGTPWERTLTDKAFTDAAFELVFRDGPEEKDRFDPEALGRLWAEFRSFAGSELPALEARLSGRAAGQLHYGEALAADRWVNVYVLLLGVALCRLLFGTWRSGVFLIGIVGSSALLLFGAMALAGTPLDILGNNLFLTLCIAGAEDFVFITAYQLRHPRRWKSGVAAILVPGFYTSLTTAIGFAALFTSDLSVTERFGLWSAAGACIEWLVTFYAFPACLQSLGLGRNWTDPSRAFFGGTVGRISRFTPSRATTRACLLVMGLGVAGFFALSRGESPARAFPRGHEYRESYEHLALSRGWEASFHVVFERSGAAGMEEVLSRVRALPNVAFVRSPLDVAAYLRRGLPQGVADLVEREVSVAVGARSGYAPDGRARAAVYLRSFDSRESEAVIAEVRSLCGPSCRPVGEIVEYLEFSGQVVRNLLESFGGSLILVSAIIVWIGRRRPPALLVRLLASTFWGVFAVTAAFAAFRIDLNQVTSVFASVLVGLTGDNAIQYLHASRRTGLERGLDSAGPASVYVMILVCLCSLSFLGLTLVPLRQLGLILAGGFAAAFFGDLIVLRGLLGSGKPQ